MVFFHLCPVIVITRPLRYHMLGPLTLSHVVSLSSHGFFQPNQRPGSDSDDQNKSIGGVSKSRALNLPLDDLFLITFLKNLFLSFSN